MVTVTDIGTIIVRTPEIRGGRPRIAGTGVTVRRVVGWYKLGLSPEEIGDRIGHLSPAQVYAALAIIMPTGKKSKLTFREKRWKLSGWSENTSLPQCFITIQLSRSRAL